MSNTENDYIELCKQKLEEKFSFGNGAGYSQRDLEQLAQYIREHSDVQISLSTLKRIWRNDFKQGPQLATLNSLVQILDYKNWQQFKLENRDLPISSSDTPKLGGSHKTKFLGSLLGLAALCVAVSWLFWSFSKTGNSVSLTGTHSFSADKTIAKGVPNTVIFKYDVANVIADSFFIQQSWNRWRRKRIDPLQSVFSSIYFESGFHRAKLIANDSIIAVTPIHILSDGWEPHVYYSEADDRFIDFHHEQFISQGVFQIPPTLLFKKGVDTTRDVFTRVTNSRVFDISSDNFTFSSRVKLDSITTSNCPWLIIQIVTEKHIFYTKLVRKGCEAFATYKMGEIVRRGETADLSRLGQSIFDWTEIGLDVKEKTAEIKINNVAVYQEHFEEDFGNIVGISYIFDGTGSIDYVRLSNLAGSNLFEDHFDK